MLSWGPIRERHDPPRGATRSSVDAFMDSWVDWREACEDVRDAYERWGRAQAPERGLAFLSYHAALGREEQAALVHAMTTERLRAAEQ
jgi:hypothetical protein